MDLQRAVSCLLALLCLEAYAEMFTSCHHCTLLKQMLTQLSSLKATQADVDQAVITARYSAPQLTPYPKIIVLSASPIIVLCFKTVLLTVIQ
jgi:hypothetical protein